MVRNLSFLRSQQTAAERAAAWDVAPPKHREPDAEILEHEDLEIVVKLSETPGEKATYWTCDFSHEYVTINGDYRT